MKSHFILAITFLLSVCVHAQNGLTIHSKNGGKINVEVFEKDKPVKTNEALFYTWIKAGRLHTTQGAYEGKLLHGNFTRFYENNQIKEKGVFKRGLKNEVWKTWYENGKLKEQTTWQNGIKSGVYKKFSSDGSLVLLSNFYDGKLHGVTTSYQNGKLRRTTYYKDGEEVNELPKVKKEKKPKIKKSTSGKAE